MKKIWFKHILLVCVFFIIGTTKVYAISRDETINGNLNNYIDYDKRTVKFSSWHYWEGNTGYWKFKRSDNDKFEKIYDDKVRKWFSGTHKRLPGGSISETFKLSSKVKKFIDIYGADRLGIKFDVGNSKSVKGGRISYKIYDDKIKVDFYGELNYVRNNMWQSLNPGVARQMERDVYTPQVADGCGVNKISVGGGDTGHGSGSITVNESMVRNARHIGNWLEIGGEKSSWNTFKYGGNNGVIFEFPINIKYYDLNVETETPTINNYFKGNNGNWVKVGSEFEVNQRGSTSNYDDVVKVNYNKLELNGGGNNTEITGYIDTNESQSTRYSLNSDRNISVRECKSVRDNKFVKTTYRIKANVESEFRIRGWSNLGNEKGIYKQSSWSGNIYIKSDGTAPYGNSRINYDTDSDRLRVEVKDVTDNNGSGVKDVWVKVTDRRDPNKSTKITLNKNYDGKYIYENNILSLFNGTSAEVKVEVWSDDNVGNKRLLSEKDVDVLKLNASIVRDLEPHEPVFFTKEKGRVKVKLKGYFERVDIIFPDELKGLNTSVNLNPKMDDEYEYEFKIPDKVKSNSYIVTVIGHKGNKTLEDRPSLKVQGSIKSILRTRIRAGE